MEEKRPNREQLLEMASGFQAACVVGAAAELDVFTILGNQFLSADELAGRLGADRRATAMLLDAVAALRLLDKQDGRFTVPAELTPLLTDGSPQSILPMLRHRMNVLRSWSQLAWVARAGIPAPRSMSVRGAAGDRADFVAAMHTHSGPIADDLVAQLGPPKFDHLLDVGGASGTWTLAFLRANPEGRATLFDLPDAIEQARARIGNTEFADRVMFAAGDFYTDELPGKVDYAWVSAIVHQHSREHNRVLFGKISRAVIPGGRIAIRDVVMNADHTEPRFGALFAVNMLANTETGTTFSFDELAEDLMAAGFTEPELTVAAEDMSSVVTATRATGD